MPLLHLKEGGTEEDSKAGTEYSTIHIDCVFSEPRWPLPGNSWGEITVIRIGAPGEPDKYHASTRKVPQDTTQKDQAPGETPTATRSDAEFPL